ncbi:MAG: hypothetical protein ACI9F9_001207 [Candidatus Paceibacteria bacterium]|jgi:hypothetical protein
MKMLIRHTLQFLGAAFLASCSSPKSLGLDAQAYPAGIISTARADWSLQEDRSLSIHAGYNVTERDDFGEHEDESGAGPGLGISARQYFGEQQSGWFAGGRLDLWWLDIDWEDQPPSSGQTDVVVLQPTAQGGYRWVPANSAWSVDLYAAGGLEINVSTSGEDVGEGAIGLIGLGVGYSF